MHFLDDNPNIRECMGYPVIGKVKGAKEYPGAKFIVAIGNPEIRQKIQEQLEIGKGICCDWLGGWQHEEYYYQLWEGV